MTCSSVSVLANWFLIVGVGALILAISFWYPAYDSRLIRRASSVRVGQEDPEQSIWARAERFCRHAARWLFRIGAPSLVVWFALGVISELRCPVA